MNLDFGQHVNRRAFLVLGAVCAAGCAAGVPGSANISGSKTERVVNAGAASQYLADGIYSRYRDQGFFIVRRGANLFALSAICTHRSCKLEAKKDKTFYCPCHGSTFNPDGKVTEGPARKNLPVFEISTNEKGELLVKMFS
jgi:cytochrome b6-f complex iron-sulfur subunit